ncbi:MAG: Redoxin domain protein [Nocardioides sp.]|jgi:thiol-disulfide isomerase/thioredoxin|nr:Redoxin domain protein [Nocardioides sp.]
MSSRTPRTFPAVLGLALASVLLLAGCNSLGGTNSGGYIEGNGQVRQIAVADRADPVQLAGETLEGDPIDLADFRGQVVVVNVWWSQCGPCISEMAMLTRTAGEYAGKASFVGINTRDSSADNGLAFQRDRGVDYPSIYASGDKGGEALLAFDGRITVNAVPTTAILDKQGRVAAVINGPIPSQLTLTDVIDELAAEDG